MDRHLLRKLIKTCCTNEKEANNLRYFVWFEEVENTSYEAKQPSPKSSLSAKSCGTGAGRGLKNYWVHLELWE